MQLPHIIIRSRTRKMIKASSCNLPALLFYPVLHSLVPDQLAASITGAEAKSGRTPNSCIA